MSLAMFDALIIDANPESRTNLKQVAHHGEMYGSVFTTNNLNEALSHLEKGDKKFDIVFVSSYFEDRAISRFVDRAKVSPCGNDTAYIMLFKGNDNDATDMAGKLLSGADGFLIEPYSVKAVADTAKVAARVKMKNAEARMAAASGMVVASMVDALDNRAEDLFEGKKSKPYSKQMKVAANQFKILAGDALDTFLDRLIERTQDAKPRTEKGYAGASKRVKQLEKTKPKEESKESDEQLAVKEADE